MLAHFFVLAVTQAWAGWFEQQSNCNFALYDVHAVNAQVGWAAGAQGQVVRTINGGTTWELRPISGAVNIWALFAFDGSRCIVADQTGTFWRTTSGGLQWVQVRPPSGRSINGIHFFDDQLGIALGDPVGSAYQVLETTNGGVTWTQSPTAPPGVSPPNFGFAHSVDWVGTEIGVFGTNGFVIWRTSDGGAAWDSLGTPIQFIHGLVIDDSGTGFASGSGGDENRLIRSGDFGITWSEVSSPTAALLKVFDWVPGTSEVWGLTGQDGLFQSTDSGDNWTPHVLFPPFTAVAEDVDFADELTGWCVGWQAGGRIFRYVNTSGIGASSIAAARLHVGPNPFRDQVIFDLNLVPDGSTALLVHDASGRMVRHLAFPGSSGHRVIWDGRDERGHPVGAGVYFYRVDSHEGIASGRLVKLP